MPVPSDWDLNGKAALVTTGGHFATPSLAAALAEAGAKVAVAGGPAEATIGARRVTGPSSATGSSSAALSNSSISAW